MMWAPLYNGGKDWSDEAISQGKLLPLAKRMLKGGKGTSLDPSEEQGKMVSGYQYLEFCTSRFPNYEIIH